MKNKIILLIVSILMVFSSIGQGASNSIPVTINGYKISVMPAPIVMNGKKVDNNTRSFVYDDRTLVHIRFLEQYTDAKVSWENKTNTATIDYKGKQIKLSIDYAVATIDGVEKILDKGSIPRLAKFVGESNSKTMVPLSFLADAMGFEVGWDYKNKNAYINSKAAGKPEESKDKNNNTNKISDIKKEIVDSKEAIVIYGSKDVKWNTMQFTDPGRIVVDLMNSTMENGVMNHYDYELAFIKGIRLSQFSPDKNYKPDDKIVRLVLDVKDGISGFDVKVNTSKNKIIIFPIKKTSDNLGSLLSANIESSDLDRSDSIIEVIDNFVPKDKLIVIDPGHGGSQPGASSPNGIDEKDINLQISLKLNSALKNAGYIVLMTRSEDITLDNYERANFANRNLAAVFISIHANSSESSSLANGVEILYAPAFKGTYKQIGQKNLSEFVLDEVLKSTGAKKRGIIERPKLVVARETQMPAILLEVGFLSNPEEERLISNSDYQNKIVSGIVSGLKKYFDAIK